MPPLPKPHANSGYDPSAGDYPENSGVPRSTLACTTRCPGRLHASRSTGVVLNTAEKLAPDSCGFHLCDSCLESSACRTLILNPLLHGRFFLLIPPFRVGQLNIRSQLRHSLHREPRLFRLSTTCVVLIGPQFSAYGERNYPLDDVKPVVIAAADRQRCRARGSAKCEVFHEPAVPGILVRFYGVTESLDG